MLEELQKPTAKFKVDDKVVHRDYPDEGRVIRAMRLRRQKTKGGWHLVWFYQIWYHRPHWYSEKVLRKP